MGKLTTYIFVSLNGYFKGENEDISWAKSGSKEESDFAANNLRSENILLFGRVTYDLMASYWPTQAALKNDSIVAGGMNKAEKIVFSKTLKNPEWNNTRVIDDNLIEEVKKLKRSDKALTLLGSGSILSQFAEAGLIDELQVMIHPVVLKEGTPLLEGVQHPFDMKLMDTKMFNSGVVLHSYTSLQSKSSE